MIARANSHILRYHNQLATYSRKLALILTLDLTLYDPGIPEHNLVLTLHEPRKKAFCKPATSPVDSYVASLYRWKSSCRQLIINTPTHIRTHVLVITLHWGRFVVDLRPHSTTPTPTSSRGSSRGCRCRCRGMRPLHSLHNKSNDWSFTITGHIALQPVLSAQIAYAAAAAASLPRAIANHVTGQCSWRNSRLRCKQTKTEQTFYAVLNCPTEQKVEMLYHIN